MNSFARATFSFAFFILVSAATRSKKNTHTTIAVQRKGTALRRVTDEEEGNAGSVDILRKCLDDGRKKRCSLNCNNYQIPFPDKSDVTECVRRGEWTRLRDGKGKKREEYKEKRGKRERERDCAVEGGSICIREHSGVNQGPGTFGLWGAVLAIFPLKIYVFIHARTARTEDDDGRQGQITSGKSVCFFITLDFIFESIFFAPTVTHC